MTLQWSPESIHDLIALRAHIAEHDAAASSRGPPVNSHVGKSGRALRCTMAAPDESGLKRREKGLAKAGNARVRRGVIQLAWRFLMFQKDSALVRWYRTRTEGPSGARKTTMIVALARKLLIALWRLVTTGEVPDGVELRPAA
jgi:transposase